MEWYLWASSHLSASSSCCDVIKIAKDKPAISSVFTLSLGWSMQNRVSTFLIHLNISASYKPRAMVSLQWKCPSTCLEYQKSNNFEVCIGSYILSNLEQFIIMSFKPSFLSLHCKSISPKYLNTRIWLKWEKWCIEFLILRALNFYSCFIDFRCRYITLLNVVNSEYLSLICYFKRNHKRWRKRNKAAVGWRQCGARPPESVIVHHPWLSADFACVRNEFFLQCLQ